MPPKPPPALDQDTLDDVARVLWHRPGKLEESDLPANVQAALVSERNSEAAFGRRMRERLRRLIEQPAPLVQSYRDRYELFLEHCDRLTPKQAHALNILLGTDASLGYEPIPKEADIQLPRDNVPQFDFQVGWHFFVGSCTGIDPRGGEAEYGIEVVFFRYALLPPRLADELGLSSVENQIVDVQFVMSRGGDPGRYVQAEPVAIAGTTGLLDFDSSPFRVAVGQQRAESVYPDELFPLRVQVKDAETGLAVDLHFPRAKTWFLQGDHGLAPGIMGVGSLYYSYCGLELDETRSRLSFDGEEISLQPGGLFWMDHQWTTGLIPQGGPRSILGRAVVNVVQSVPGQQPPQLGWDWFCVQFDADFQFTAAAGHGGADETGTTAGDTKPPERRVALQFGKLIGPDRSVQEVSGTVTISDWAHSAATDTWHPNGWMFELDGAPPEVARFTMAPIDRTGQFASFAQGAEYREGAVAISSPGGERIGRGFAEGTGYSDCKRRQLQIAGPPHDDATVALVKATPHAQMLAAKSFAVLAGAILIPPIAVALAARVAWRAFRRRSE